MENNEEMKNSESFIPTKLEFKVHFNHFSYTACSPQIYDITSECSNELVGAFQFFKYFIVIHK